MKHWQHGRFDRTKIPGFFRTFAPVHTIEVLHDLDLAELWRIGKRLLLLDVDNTLVAWKTESFSDPVLAWVAEAKAMGFDLCIISNTRRVIRLARLAQMLQVETVKGKFKPSSEMYHLALAKFNRKPEEALMVGDQLMTDILGANRAGIESVWVRKMNGPEFVGTKVNRFIEARIAKRLFRHIEPSEHHRGSK